MSDNLLPTDEELDIEEKLFNIKFPNFKDVIAPAIEYIIRPLYLTIEKNSPLIIFDTKLHPYSYIKHDKSMKTYDSKLVKYINPNLNGDSLTGEDLTCYLVYNILFNNLLKYNALFCELNGFTAVVKLDHHDQKAIIFCPAERFPIVTRCLDNFNSLLRSYLLDYEIIDLLKYEETKVIDLTGSYELQTEVLKLSRDIFYNQSKLNKLMQEQDIDIDNRDHLSYISNRAELFKNIASLKMIANYFKNNKKKYDEILSELHNAEKAYKSKDWGEIENLDKIINSRGEDIDKLQNQISSDKIKFKNVKSQLKNTERINANPLLCLYWLYITQIYNPNITFIRNIFKYPFLIYKFIQKQCWEFKMADKRLWNLLEYTYRHKRPDKSYISIGKMMMYKMEDFDNFDKIPFTKMSEFWKFKN